MKGAVQYLLITCLIMLICTSVFAEEPFKITMTLMGGPKTENTWMEKELEKRLGVDFEFIMLPGWADKKTKTNLLMSDMETMPDVLWWHDQDKEFEQWVEAGLLYDMLPLLKNTTEKNIIKYYDDKTFFQAWKYGGMYKLGGDVAERCCMTTLIRKDWLDKLGLEPPTTVEELIEVARAFTFQDPDGNGIDDTYGFGGARGIGTEHEYRSFAPIMYAYGVDLYDQFMIQDDGTLKFGAVMPQTKEVLRILRDMYAEGIMDPTIVTGNEFDQETFPKGKIGIFYRWITFFNPSDPNRVNFDANNPGAELMALPPIKGPDGYGSDMPSSPDAWCFVSITKHAKDPQRVMDVLDKMMGKDLFILRKFGERGVHWDIEDGQYKQLVTSEKRDQDGVNLTCWIFDRKDDANIINTPEVTALFKHASEVTSMPMQERIAFFKDRNRPLWIEHGKTLNDLRDEVFYGIISGTEELDAFDRYVEQYYELGGKEVEQEADEYYARQMKEYAEFKPIYDDLKRAAE